MTKDEKIRKGKQALIAFWGEYNKGNAEKVVEIVLNATSDPAPLPETTDLTLPEVMDESLGADALIARLRG